MSESIGRILLSPDVLREVWSELSGWARALLLTAIFFLFAPLGLLGEMATTSTAASPGLLFGRGAVAGLFAVTLFVLGTRGGWWLLGLIPTAVGYLALSRALPSLLPGDVEVDLGDAVPALLESEIDLGTTVVVLSIYVGYVIFVLLLGTEGLRQVRVRTEIALAREIHDALVPPIGARVGGFEVHGVSRASHDIGGDLFDVEAREEGLVAYLADISGHGVPANSLAGMVKAAARMRLRASDRPDDLVFELDKVLNELTPPNVYATVAALRLRGDGTGEICLAGHLPVLQLGSAGPPVRHESRAVPAGLFADTRYEADSVELAPGDLIALFTDGLTEVEDASGEPFGLERLEATLVEERDRELAGMHAAVTERVRSWGPARDDETLVLIRRP